MASKKELTEYQKHVIKILKENPNAKNRDIADKLVLSETSVGGLLKSIYRKLNIEGGRGKKGKKQTLISKYKNGNGKNV